MEYRKTMATGAVLAAIGVIMGAFGAHALEDIVTYDRLVTWETAVQYHMYHALALILVGLIQQRTTELKSLKRASILFVVGIVLFSGSLYTLVLTDTDWLGAITPWGGISFIVAWLLCAISVTKQDKGL